jgi:hypothetical protein
MIDVVERNLVAIYALCREYDVARLDLFGSAATGAFEPGRSDIDFLVEYAPGADLGPWLSRFFDLRDRLSELLGHPVDLVMAGAVKNRFIVGAIEQQRRPLYAA